MLIEPEDEGDEHFVDAPEEGQPAAGSSKTAALKPDQRAYDGKKREPQYAHADSSCLWELVSPDSFLISMRCSFYRCHS